MEPLKALYPVCTLIKSDGTRCGSPALTGGNFCFQHIGGRIPKSKPETRRMNTPLNFIYPSGHEAIQHNLFLVVQALSEGKIDNATALTYNRLFRSAQLNLQRWQAAKSKLNHDEVEPQMMPCTEPATNAGAPQPALSLPKGLDETWENLRSGLDDPSMSSASCGENRK
jgi:hypothetical protein